MIDEDKIDILVVDDVPDKLLAIEAILEELDQNVVAVRSGKDALRRLLDRDFAVILLDVNMPDMDGFETATLIRQRQKSQHTPIIFVTAYTDEAHVWQGYSLGAVDYILAPVLPEVLRAKVGVFVELFRKNQQIKRQAEERVALAGEQAARAAAEEATRRSSFLAEASTVLARSLDYDATITGALRLIVPRLADLVAIVVPEERNPREQAEVAWTDPAEQWVRQSGPCSALPTELGRAMDRVLKTGRSEAISDLAIAKLDNPVLPPSGAEHTGPAAPLPELKAALVVPLLARGRTLGVVALGLGSARLPIRPEELALAEDLIGRTAIAIDNARLYREIQEGDRRKDEFLAMLGHELRNPLGAISTALDCLDVAGEDESIAQTAREVLQRQVQQMVRLVDDLLDVSRITRGKVELRKDYVELKSAVTRAVATTEATVAACGHVLSVSLPSEPVWLYADPTRLEQVLANLLNNAAKYTEPGGQIWLSAERQDGSVVLRVRDTGIGIPASLLPKVFDLFTQGDRSLDRSQGGLGIGLTLVRSLVELHGGRVEAHSGGPNQGSQFVVQLPLPVGHRRQPTDTAGRGPSDTSSGVCRRVLLVDDNADLASSLAALLRKAGHDVHVVHDGRAALDKVQDVQPEVIVVDIGLPGMNGYEVAERLRQEIRFERPLLVAMTGYGQAEDFRRSREAGFDHHLVKPVSLQSLQQLLANHGPAATAPATQGFQ